MEDKKCLELDGNLYLVHRMGKNRDYYAIVADLGYRRKFLTFDSGVIAECLGIMPKDLNGICPIHTEVHIIAPFKVSSFELDLLKRENGGDLPF